MHRPPARIIPPQAGPMAVKVPSAPIVKATPRLTLLAHREFAWIDLLAVFAFDGHRDASLCRSRPKESKKRVARRHYLQFA